MKAVLWSRSTFGRSTFRSRAATHFAGASILPSRLQSNRRPRRAIAAFRERFAGAARRTNRRSSHRRRPKAEAGAGRRAGWRKVGRAVRRRAFRRGRQGGRLTFSLTHQLNLVDEVTIADGVPKLDYLDGEPIGQAGGRPRHEVQFETGYYNNGYGARLQGNWRSGTTVDSSSGDLHFSPYFDLDLRLFANLGENFDLVSKHPFFRGASVRFDVDNIFNNRPKVRDEAGADAAKLPARPAGADRADDRDHVQEAVHSAPLLPAAAAAGAARRLGRNLLGIRLGDRIRARPGAPPRRRPRLPTRTHFSGSRSL